MLMKRRGFLIASAGIATGFVIGYRSLDASGSKWPAIPLEEGQTLLNPYVVVDDKGITILAPRSEMGQGIHTTLAALVAEELDVALADIRVEHAPASELYSNSTMFPAVAMARRNRRPRLIDRFRSNENWTPTMLTGMQGSIREGYFKMRKAGAAARAVLVEAAASRLDVSARELWTSDGAVEGPDGSRIPYVELAEEAARITPPQDPVLKEKEKWNLLGRSQGRVDMQAKCDGSAIYSVDVRLPGMLFGSVRRNPGIGGKMISYDASTASDMPGVRKIIPLSDGVIVVATNTWYAERASRAVAIEWESAAYPETTEEHFELVRQAIFEEVGATQFRNDGDVDASLVAPGVVSGEYSVPYQAHATMEPMNAVALLNDGKLDIWAGTQFPTKAVVVGAELCSIARDDVRVTTTYMGCGFGRRLEMDFIELAVQAAQALEGTPVSVSWTREEDMTHDAYRPLAIARYRARIADGRPDAVDIKVSSPPLHDSYSLREGGRPAGKSNKATVMGLHEQPYTIDNYRIAGYAAPAEHLLPVGWWRSVGESHNCFFHESIIDELAHAAGADPLLMRLELLHHETSREVLQAVADMSNWGTGLPTGHARGVAYALSSGAPTAQVVEVRLVDGSIEIIKAYVAVDVGIALDPRNIEAQLHSALIFGLAAARTGEITVSEGRVEQRNFNHYSIPRMHEIPEIETRIIENGEKIF